MHISSYGTFKHDLFNRVPRTCIFRHMEPLNMIYSTGFREHADLIIWDLWTWFSQQGSANIQV